MFAGSFISNYVNLVSLALTWSAMSFKEASHAKGKSQIGMGLVLMLIIRNRSWFCLVKRTGRSGCDGGGGGDGLVHGLI